MKKNILTLSLAVMAGVPGWAQYQLPNNDFEATWVKCYPWEAGDFVNSAKGTTPPNWCVSNVSQSENIMPLVAEACTGYNNTGKGAKLINVKASIGDNNAPGYITLGTTWATAETKMTAVQNADGGCFGGVPFIYHPDGIQLRYQRSVSNGSENCSLVAYLWKGEWTQASVPSNTAVGLFSWGTATKVPMTDRDRNILGLETLTGGDVSHTDNAELIAKLESYKSVATNGWETWKADFYYSSNSVPEKLNIIISATDYFSDRSGIKSGNYIMIDDVMLLYYSELASGSYNGNALVLNDDGTIENVDEVYAEEKISLKSNGHGATIEKSYDEETAQLTITVKGEDISVNPSNFHTYTIQFKKPLAKGDVNGDGQVTIADVTALVNIILGKSEDELGMADVNGDGPVTIADVTALVNIILGK